MSQFEKRFVVTLVASGKTNFGIEFLTKCLLAMLASLSGYRKCYRVYFQEFHGKEKEELDFLIAKQAMEKLSEKFKEIKS